MNYKVTYGRNTTKLTDEQLEKVWGKIKEAKDKITIPVEVECELKIKE
jgi:hypothetical protein